MRVYETTFIINPQSDDATIEKHVSNVKDIILKTDGKIISENHMGTRRLAYPINKLTQGYYATFIYEAPIEILPLLDRHFKVNEALIRNLTVRIDGDPEEYMKQQDPFGKHGTERGDRPQGGYHRSDRDSDPDDERRVRPPVVETPVVETPATETQAEDTPVEDKPKEDEL